MSQSRHNRTPDPEPRECVDCGETVSDKRFAALLSLYPPNEERPDVPSVPVRCLACAELHVNRYIASDATDPEGLDWVPVKAPSPQALRAYHLGRTRGPTGQYAG